MAAPSHDAGPDSIRPKTYAVLGVPLALTDYDLAVRLILSWAEAGRTPRLVAAANTHVATLNRRDAVFRTALEKFDLVVPDGMPLLWHLNLFGGAGLTDRVYGPELMLRCLAAAQGPGHRHFFLGGTDLMRQRLVDVLQARFPGLNVAGGFSPPFGHWGDSIDSEIVNRLRAARPDFVWVGLGCPKQEYLLGRLRDELPPAVYLAVGAAFPLISGEVRQAPLHLQRLGLEWAFRLAVEPGRLWKRYLVHNTLFVWYTAFEVAGRLIRCRAARQTDGPC